MTKPTGIHCPACGRRMLKTVDSRPVHGGVRRRRECTSCKHRVTTIEKVAGGKR